MSPRTPQDRRRRGAVVERSSVPSGAELAARLAALRWYLPPVDQRRLRRTWKRGKR